MIDFKTQQVKTIAGDGRYDVRYFKMNKAIFYFFGDLIPSLPYSTKKPRDGIGLNASFQSPRQLTIDSNGTIYFADNNTVRMMSTEYEVTTIGKVEGTLLFTKKVAH